VKKTASRTRRVGVEQEEGGGEGKRVAEREKNKEVKREREEEKSLKNSEETSVVWAG
jgi:hypothetical protein